MNQRKNRVKKVLVESLMQETGMSRFEVEQVVQELVEHGLIKFASQGMAIRLVG